MLDVDPVLPMNMQARTSWNDLTQGKRTKSGLVVKVLYFYSQSHCIGGIPAIPEVKYVCAYWKWESNSFLNKLLGNKNSAWNEMQVNLIWGVIEIMTFRGLLMRLYSRLSHWLAVSINIISDCFSLLYIHHTIITFQLKPYLYRNYFCSSFTVQLK